MELISTNSEYKIGEKINDLTNDRTYVKYGSKHHLIDVLRNKRTGETKGNVQSVMIYTDNITELYFFYFGLIILMIAIVDIVGGFGIKILGKQLDKLLMENQISGLA